MMMTKLAEWIETEAMLMAREAGSTEEALEDPKVLDIWKERARYAIQSFIGYNGAHAALMDHPRTLAALLTIALMAKTAEEAADLTDPATLIDVRRALDVVLAEHAQRRKVTLDKLMEKTV